MKFITYEDLLLEEEKEREKKSTDPKHLEKGLSFREELEQYGYGDKIKITTR